MASYTAGGGQADPSIAALLAGLQAAVNGVMTPTPDVEHISKVWSLGCQRCGARSPLSAPPVIGQLLRSYDEADEDMMRPTAVWEVHHVNDRSTRTFQPYRPQQLRCRRCGRLVTASPNKLGKRYGDRPVGEIIPI